MQNKSQQQTIATDVATPDDAEIATESHVAANLIHKFDTRAARVGVIGMGYVGLPTMVAVAEAGFTVTGFDINADRIGEIEAGRSYIEDVKDATLKPLVESGNILATGDLAVIRDMDVVLVCVPTPINKNKEPDLKPMETAVEALVAHMKRQQLVVFQSTTFPGSTEEFVLPELEKNGLKAGVDFYLAFALERIDPGNQGFEVRDLPKVVGGVSPECTKVGVEFFSTFVDQVVPVSSPKVAEMTKLLENTFRSVNIAMVNELAILCGRMDIDIWEVVEAAATKPFGFMPFYPGPGVGGHCIPVDPFYLAWKAKEYDFYVNFIQLAAETNDHMPYYTLTRIIDALGDYGKPLKNAQLLVLGVTFKENIDDTRNSPALRVMELLTERGANISYHDSHIPALNVNGHSMKSVTVDSQMLQQFDAAVILVNHEGMDWVQIVDNSKLVIDTRNATKKLGHRANVFKL